MFKSLKKAVMVGTLLTGLLTPLLPQASAADKPVEIKYWYAFGGNIEKTNLALVEEFNNSQDEVHVTAEFQGNYADLHAKTQAAFVAKNAPNVTLNEIASMGNFARGGMTEDLTPFLERDAEEVQIDDFYEALLGNSYVDEGMYGLPYFRSTPIFYVNKSLVEKAGIDMDKYDEEWTWDNWKEVLKAVTEKTDAIGQSQLVDIWAYEGLIQTAGGSMLNEDETQATFNQEAGVKLAETMKELLDAGYIKIPTGENGGETVKQDFANQKIAIKVGSTADIRDTTDLSKDQNFEFVTKFFPKLEKNAVPTGGSNLVMIAGQSEEEKEASWKFMKWMTAKEQTIKGSQGTGYLVTRKLAAESDEMKEFYKEYPEFQTALKQLEYGNPRPLNSGYAEASTFINEAYSAILIDGAPIQETLDAAVDTVNGLLAQ